MELLSDEQWKEIKPVFVKAWPNEAIVAVWPDRWEQIENVSPAPAFAFQISEADNARLQLDPPLLMLHSHPNGDSTPSDEDTLGQLATGWAWGIVAVHAAAPAFAVTAVDYPELWGDCVPIAPLEGRSYLWGIRDCWTLARDYLRLQGHCVPNCPRALVPSRYPSGHWGHDQFAYWPKKLGFKEVARHNRKPGDVFLLCFRSRTQNHCGIWLGEGRILHQPGGQNSHIMTIGDEEKFIERNSVTFMRWPNKAQSTAG
jgi:proteasome lid subunit RPN8/RPN11